MKLLTPDFGLLLWTLLAFLVVLFILSRFAWPAIVKGLKERERSIADALATAEQVKAEMAQLKSENEALLAKRDLLQEKIDQWHKAHPGFLRQLCNRSLFS